jgi:hypothetical protein
MIAIRYQSSKTLKPFSCPGSNTFSRILIPISSELQACPNPGFGMNECSHRPLFKKLNSRSLVRWFISVRAFCEFWSASGCWEFGSIFHQYAFCSEILKLQHENQWDICCLFFQSIFPGLVWLRHSLWPLDPGSQFMGMDILMNILQYVSDLCWRSKSHELFPHLRYKLS